MVFLPYITFGKWDLRRKRILFLTCFPLLVILFTLSAVLFYNSADTQFCSWCNYLNCVPYDPSLGCSFDEFGDVGP